MMHAAAAVLSTLTHADDPTPSPSPTAPPIDPERVTPGILGLLSFLVLCIAVFLLYRSMRKQFAKIDPNLPEGPADRRRDADVEVIAQAEARGAAEAAARAKVQQSKPGTTGTSGTPRTSGTPGTSGGPGATGRAGDGTAPGT